MKRGIIAAMALLALGDWAVGADEPPTVKLSAPLEQVLVANFTLIVHLHDLPADEIHELPAGMADRGKPFDATDVSMGNPNRRFILAGHSATCDFVCYEHGGVGYHIHLLIFTPVKDGMKQVFEGLISKDASDVETAAALKKVIRSGAVNDLTKEIEKNPNAY